MIEFRYGKFRILDDYGELIGEYKDIIEVEKAIAELRAAAEEKERATR